MEHEYVKMKKVNPKFPFLVRECKYIQPKLWARYGEIVSFDEMFNNYELKIQFYFYSY